MDFGPPVCSLQICMHQLVALWPSPRNVLRQRLTIFGIEYYQIILLLVYLPWSSGVDGGLVRLNRPPKHQVPVLGP